MAQLGRFSFSCNSLFSSYRSLSNTARYYATAEPSPLRSNLPAQNLSSVGLAGSLKVASEALPSEVATVGVFINAGSSLESEQNSGVTNVLKFLVANGTVKRSGKRVVEEIENIGGRFYVQTEREKTVFLAQVAKGDLEKAVEVLGSVVENLRGFSSQELLDQGKRRALREIDNDDNNLDQLSLEHLHSIAYQASSLGNATKGTSTGVKALTPEAVSSFASKYFTSDRLVVAGVGGVDQNALLRLVGNYFGGVQAKGATSFHAEQPFIGSAVTVHDDSTNDVHYTVAFEGTSLYSDEYYILQVIQELIGNYTASSGVGNNSSTRLAELFGNEHLASRFQGFNINYAHTGLVGVQVATTADKLEDGLAEIVTDYVRIAQNARPAEVGRAKARLINAVRRSRDDTLSIAQQLGTQLLGVGRAIPVAETLARIDDIDATQVRKVASAHFVDTEPAIVAIGNTIELPDYNQVRGWTHWWRT